MIACSKFESDLYSFIQAQVNAAPLVKREGQCTTGAYCIDLPPGEHVLNQTIKIPVDKNINIKGCGPWATVIINNTGTPYIVEAEGGNNVGHVFTMQGFSSEGGAVLVNRRRGLTRIQDAKFTETTVPAMHFVGEDSGLGAVRVIIDTVDTAFCQQGASFEMRSNSLITVERSRFIATYGEAILMDSIGSLISNCHFTGADECFVRYGGDVERSSHHTLRDSYFGNEDRPAKNGQGTIDAPDYSVIIGPARLPGAVLRFRDNYHAGRENDTKPGALAAFRMEDSARDVHISGSYFSSSYQNWIVNEANSGLARRNYWHQNMVQNGAPPVFSAGGVGWTQD